MTFEPLLGINDYNNLVAREGSRRVTPPPCELVPHERSVLRESEENFLSYFQYVA